MWPKHVEEMKHDHFYEGLNPKYQHMLTHKVDGENPAGYSDLLLAAWKLEKRTEARNSLPPKTAVTSGSSAIHSLTPWNLFPSFKLKGNCTFTTWAVTIGNAEGKADSGVQQEEEGEMEPLADKEVKCQAEQKEQIRQWSISIALPRWSNFTNRKTGVVSDVGVLTTSWGIAHMTLANLHGKVLLTPNRGWQRREAGPLRSQLSLSKHPQKWLLEYKDIMKDSLPESRPPHSLEWTWKHSLG